MTNQKFVICYSMLKKTSFLLFLVLISCNYNKRNYKKKSSELVEFIKSKNLDNKDSITTVLLLSDEGCFNCNNRFSKLIQNHINRNNTLIIITASGAKIDISAFQDSNIKNIYFDDINEIAQLNLTQNSGVFFLKNNEIDTIISIQAIDIENQLKFIDFKINKE